MSDYGLVTYNDNDEVQIDSIYRNYSIKNSGTKATTGTSTTVTLTAAAYPPIIALRAIATKEIVVGSCIKSGANFTGFRIMRGSGAGTYNVPWVSFTNQNATEPSDKYGLLVKNASGQVCFSSEMRYLKIKTVNTITVPNPVTSYVDVTVQSVSANYFVMYPYGYAFQPVAFNPPNQWWIRMWSWGFVRINNTTVRIRGLILTEFQAAGVPSANYPTNFQFMEVGY